MREQTVVKSFARKLLWQFQIKNFIKALRDCGKVLRINCRSLSAKPLSDKGF